jgi:MFS family permease
MALAMIAASFAGFIGAPLVNKLVALSGGNWRLVWLFITATTILSACIAFLFVKERPQDLGQVPDGMIPDPTGNAAAPASTLVSRYAWTPAEAYRTSTYWLTVVAAAASQWPFFFFVAHWIMHLRGKGIGPAEAALAMGFFSLGGIIGRLIGGWLMDRMAARYVMMLGISVYFVGSWLAVQAGPGALTVAYIAALCYGAAFGWAFVAQNTMLGHFFGPAAFPKVNGNLQAITAVMVAASGVVGGKLFDMFKSYTPAFQLNAAICVVGIICLIFATMPKAPNSDKATV